MGALASSAYSVLTSFSNCGFTFSFLNPEELSLSKIFQEETLDVRTRLFTSSSETLERQSLFLTAFVNQYIRESFEGSISFRSALVTPLNEIAAINPKTQSEEKGTLSFYAMLRLSREVNFLSLCIIISSPLSNEDFVARSAEKKSFMTFLVDIDLKQREGQRVVGVKESPGLYSLPFESSQSGSITSNLFPSFALDLLDSILSLHTQGIVFGNVTPMSISLTGQQADMGAVWSDFSCLSLVGNSAEPHTSNPSYSDDLQLNGLPYYTSDLYGYITVLCEHIFGKTTNGVFGKICSNRSHATASDYKDCFARWLSRLDPVILDMKNTWLQDALRGRSVKDWPRLAGHAKELYSVVVAARFLLNFHSVALKDTQIMWKHCQESLGLNKEKIAQLRNENRLGEITTVLDAQNWSVLGVKALDRNKFSLRIQDIFNRANEWKLA